MRSLWLLLFAMTAHAEPCTFDHVLVTLPAESFQVVRAFFKDPKVQKKTGAAWSDGAMKGLLMFEDKSYLEVWNAAEFGKYGYQDACRVMSQEQIEEIGKSYGKKPTAYGKFMVVGREGVVGEAAGGMFFIWDPTRKIDAAKNGIRQIWKRVAAPDHLAEDYKKGGLKLEVVDKQRVKAVDEAGVVRVARVGSGLVAVRFSRSGSEKETLTIRAPISLELAPSVGTLIFQAEPLEKL